MFEDAQAAQSFAVPSVDPDPARDGEDADLLHLLTATGRGDRRAFERLYLRTSRYLMGRAISILNEREAAEDVLQEAYVRIWTNAGRFDGMRGYAMGWMIRILRNTAIDRLRRDRVLARYVLYLDELPNPPAASDPIEDRLDLSVALGGLSPEHLSIVRRVVVQGWTQREVSQQDDVPTPTTKARAQRSLKRLRTALTQDLTAAAPMPDACRVVG